VAAQTALLESDTQVVLQKTKPSLEPQDNTSASTNTISVITDSAAASASTPHFNKKNAKSQAKQAPVQ
jgi:hypothetical protein